MRAHWRLRRFWIYFISKINFHTLIFFRVGFVCWSFIFDFWLKRFRKSLFISFINVLARMIVRVLFWRIDWWCLLFFSLLLYFYPSFFFSFDSNLFLQLPFFIFLLYLNFLEFIFHCLTLLFYFLKHSFLFHFYLIKISLLSFLQFLLSFKKFLF